MEPQRWLENSEYCLEFTPDSRSGVVKLITCLTVNPGSTGLNLYSIGLSDEILNSLCMTCVGETLNYVFSLTDTKFHW